MEKTKNIYFKDKKDYIKNKLLKEHEYYIYNIKNAYVWKKFRIINF